MEAVFLKLLNMSITASWLALAVIAVRFLLKKAPKAFSVILWALVGVRLVLPISFESILSLVPSAETVPGDIIYSSVPVIDSGIAALDSAVNPFISQSLTSGEAGGAMPMQILTAVASAIWAAGAAAMLLYTVISYMRFRRKVREAAPLDKNIYLCDGIGTPFILGVIRPRIYLPSDIGVADMEYVISHEKAHIKRGDHLWKPLGFLLLTVYWFNPVLWIAYILLCRDIELACDERVIKGRGTEIKKSYSEALVNCSVPRKMIAACPLAFGEGSVKGRIKSVLNYKKPAFWIIAVSIIACIALAACFLTNPITKVKLPENVKIIEVSSNDHISFSVKEIVLDSDEPYIKIEWKNGSESMLVYGEPFDLEHEDIKTGEVSSCMKEDVGFNLPAYYVKPGEKSEHIYGLSGFDVSKDGIYVFRTNAQYKYGNVMSSSNFVVVFGIGDISEYEARLEENPNGGFQTVGVPVGVWPDLNHNGVPESVVLYSVRNENGGLEDQRLGINEEGEEIFSEDAGDTHIGENALFLYNKDGEDYLLRYNPGMWQGAATYKYQLFYLAEDGSEIVVKTNSVKFDVNFFDTEHHSFDSKAIDTFLAEINELLLDSTELMNTDYELSGKFKRGNRLHHIPTFLLNSEEWGFKYDYDKTLLENLEKYKSTMEAYWAEAE